MKTVKTTKELLDLRNSAGVIEIDGDLCIAYNVPWEDVGEHIAGIKVSGNLSCGGSLSFEGDLYCAGNLYCGGHIYCGGRLECGGFLTCVGNLYCNSHLFCRISLTCSGNLYCGSYLCCVGRLSCMGSHLIVLGDLKWQLASMPCLPDKYYIRRVVPHGHQRAHWQERLGLDLSRGCYDELCSKVLKHIIRLLGDEKWSSTERWMLETLRDSENPAPDWVNGIKGEK